MLNFICGCADRIDLKLHRPPCPHKGNSVYVFKKIKSFQKCHHPVLEFSVVANLMFSKGQVSTKFGKVGQNVSHDFSQA